ncbi:MAG: Tim44/TimA family putative adaptor protein [Rhizobiaceae bacterium]|nr:Tim44/TimA family putative adaptor protein [Rhizobiaceae bacterium]
MQFLDLTTLITIVIAVFVLLRLRSVLGQRTGYEKPEDFLNKKSQRNQTRNDDGAPDNVVKLPERNTSGAQERENPAIKEIDELAKPRTKLNRGLKDLLAADQSFSPKEFVGGANMAYEMIVNAFADGDDKSLRNLLAPEVFEGFNEAIKTRQKNGETVKSNFVGIDKSEIKEAQVKDNEAQVTVRFESQIVSATFNKDGEIIEGDENEVVRVTDLWTFARDIRSRDPNWKLVATEAEG